MYVLQGDRMLVVILRGFRQLLLDALQLPLRGTNDDLYKRQIGLLAVLQIVD